MSMSISGNGNTNNYNYQLPPQGQDPDAYAQQYANEHNISLEEAKAELKEKYGDPQAQQGTAPASSTNATGATGEAESVSSTGGVSTSDYANTSIFPQSGANDITTELDELSDFDNFETLQKFSPEDVKERLAEITGWAEDYCQDYLEDLHGEAEEPQELPENK